MPRTIPAPDDFHVHLRDGEMLRAVVPYTAAQFQRALVMPNLIPPVTTPADAKAYRQRILDALPPGSTFSPLMTLYLTDMTTPEVIEEASKSGFVVACKLYPSGATTNSARGVTSLDNIDAALKAMERTGLVLCVHGEMTTPDIDVFDKERAFVENVMPQLLNNYPALRIVLEHVTTKDSVELVQTTPGNRLAATVTPQHLLYSRNALFAGAKLHPHMYCLPILKRDDHRKAIMEAIKADTRGAFFAGTDSAPHPRTAKLCESGCAGIFSATSAVELYAEAFEDADALDKLEGFLCRNGARFYGLPVNESSMNLHRAAEDAGEGANGAGDTKVVPNEIPVGPDIAPVVPLRAGESLRFRAELVA